MITLLLCCALLGLAGGALADDDATIEIGGGDLDELFGQPYGDDILRLPANLRTIEAEAFYGDTSLNYLILPEGIQRIESKAFANSSLRRIYLPDSISYIAPDAFEQCPWVVGYGPDETYASVFFDAHDLYFEHWATAPTNLTAIVSGTDVILSWTGNGVAEMYAVYEVINGEDTFKQSVSAESTTIKNVSGETHTYFVRPRTLINGTLMLGKASENVSITPWKTAPTDLQISVSGANVTLTWNKNAYVDTYNVYEVNGTSLKYVKRVTAEKVTIKNVSSGRHIYTVKPRIVIDGKAAVGNASQYIEAIVYPSNTAITSYSQDGAGLVSLYYSADGREHIVYEIINEKLYQVGSGSVSPISFIVSAEGDHQYAIICPEDFNGLTPVASALTEKLTLNVRLFWYSTNQLIHASQSGISEAELSWFGVTPADQYIIMERNTNGVWSELAAVDPTCFTNILALSEGTHQIAVAARYTESGVLYQGALSTPINVVIDNEAYAPTAPELIFDDSSRAFAAAEANAPVYSYAENIELAWVENPKARSYGISLDVKNGGGWTNVLTETGVTDHSWYISAAQFQGLTADTVYRFGIRAEGVTSGDIQYTYFRVKAQNADIFINGGTAARWERSNANAGSREFAVASEMAWTATADSDWITLTAGADNLIVNVKEFPHVFGGTTRRREGTVTLTNGKKSAALTVVQGDFYSAPTISIYETELSADQAHPTIVSPAGQVFNFSKVSGTYVLLRFLEKNNSGNYVNKRWLISSNDSESLSYTWGNVAFENGKEFCIEASRHMSSASGADYSNLEAEGDSIVQRYYFKVSGSGYLLVNGKTSEEINIYRSGSVDVLSSNPWTAVSDASWLTYSTKIYSLGDAVLKVSAEENTTGSARTGHITLSSDLNSVVLTVCQYPYQLGIISPANVSTNENSPTVISSFPYVITTFGVDKIILEHQENGAWVTNYSDTHSYADITSYNFGSKDFTSGVNHRLSLSDNYGNTKVYWLKTSVSDAKYINLGKTNTSSYTVYSLVLPECASSGTFVMSASSSWKATSDSSWLSISETSGSSCTKKTITYSVAANSGGERTGMISFKINSKEYAKMQVTQRAAGTSYLTIAIDEKPLDTASYLQHLSGNGQSLDVTLYVPDDDDMVIGYSSSADWITVSNPTKNHSSTISVQENTSGSRRTGTVTYSYAGISKTITIGQEPKLSTPTLSSHTLSTDSASPTVLPYSENGIVFQFGKINNAARYMVRLRRLGDDNILTFNRYISGNGSSAYSATFDSDCFDPSYEGLYRLIIYAYDSYDNPTSSERMYFTCVAGSKVYLNGEPSLTWSNANDFSDSMDVKIASSANWTATSNVSWISVSSTSGASGASVTVSVSKNTGSSRTGKVTFKAGSASAVMSVQQCAALSNTVSIISPAFSTDRSSPTMITKPDTMTVAWDWKPQARYYIVQLQELLGDDRPGVIATSLLKSGAMYNSNKQPYTFTGLSSLLEEGKLYRIAIHRNAVRGDKSEEWVSYYYFVIDSGAAAYISITGGGSNNIFEGYGDEDSQYYTVASSYAWTARVSDSTWMMVSKNTKTQQKLDDYGDTPDDYATYYGLSGDQLCVSLLANNTGYARQGTVTISTIGATRTITVTQDAGYDPPKITSPAMGTSSSPAELAMSGFTVSWNAGVNCQSEYDIELDEQTSGTYRTVWSKYGLTSRSAAVPLSALKDNTKYRVTLYSYLNHSDERVYSRSYFITSSSTALSLTAQVDWSQVGTTGFVYITAAASGGAGGYQYGYLLKNSGGTVLQETGWTPASYYNFPVNESGNYQITVVAKDSAGKQATWNSASESVNDNNLNLSNGSYQVSVNAARNILTYSVISSSAWNAVRSDDWITLSKTSGVTGDRLNIGVAENDGVLRIGTVTLIAGKVTFTLTITQEGTTAICLSENGTTATAGSQSVQVHYAAGSSWTASSNVSWLTLSNSRGAAGSGAVTVAVQENNSMIERTGFITFVCDGMNAVYTVTQLGAVSAGNVISLSQDSWNVDTPMASSIQLEVQTNYAWTVTSYPDWVRLNIESGEGETVITVIVSANSGSSTRTGNVIFAAGNEEADLRIQQVGQTVSPVVNSFTLSSQTVRTGEKVTITAHTQYADSVQLIVDGKAYDTAYVVNNQAVIERAFTQEGTRTIEIMPSRGGAAGFISTAKTLNVTSSGPLESPTFISDGSCYAGNTKFVDWEDVPNANLYTLYISDGSSYRLIGTSQVSEYLLPGAFLSKAGTYSLEVIATGIGYSQSSGIINLNAINQSVNFSLTSPKSTDPLVSYDEIWFKVKNPSAYPVRVKITKNNDSSFEPVYLPALEPTASSNPEMKWIALEDGTYTAAVYAYASTLTTDPAEYWGCSSTVTFKVNPGSIRSVTVGNGKDNQDKDSIKILEVKTPHNVSQILVYLDGSADPICTMLADNDSTLTNWTRTWSKLVNLSLSEGEHTFKFVPVDPNGEQKPCTKKVNVYSAVKPEFIGYPNAKSVQLYKTASTGGAVLKSSFNLSDKLSIKGIAYNAYYYVETVDYAGYIAKNDVSMTQLIDWNDYSLEVISLASDDVCYYMPATSNLDYNITLEWKVTPDIPDNLGFIVYLIDEDGEHGKLLSDSIIYGSEKVTVSTSSFFSLVDMIDSDSKEYYLRVDGAAGGKIVLSARSQNPCTIYSRGYAFDAFSYLHTQMGYAANAHYATNDVMQLEGLAEVYSVLTGKWDNITLSDEAKGGLIAEQIMRKMSTTKDPTAGTFSFDVVKKVLKGVGIEISILQKLEQADMMEYLNTTGKLDSKLFEKACNADDLNSIKGKFGVLSTEISIYDAITGILDDYYTFSSVSKSDVRPYINSFREGNDTLKFAADCLEMMTYNDSTLIAYIATSFGCSYAMDTLKDVGKDLAFGLIDSYLFPGWKIGVAVGSLFNDIVFNTASTCKTVLDYSVVYETMQEYVDDYNQAWKDFYNDPEANYTKFKEKQELFLVTLRLELDLLERLINDTNKGLWQSFLNCVDERNKKSFDSENYYELFANVNRQALEQCYIISVAPYGIEQ